jgi:hypothetical protein
MTSSHGSEASRRIGQLASATGLPVRTLHYYEEIGLLVASGRSDAGRTSCAAESPPSSPVKPLD